VLPGSRLTRRWKNRAALARIGASGRAPMVLEPAAPIGGHAPPPRRSVGYRGAIA